MNYSWLSSEYFFFVSSLNKSVEPKTFQEACSDINLITAMNKEMEALHRNRTWIVTNLPSGRKAIGCKWIYKIEYKSIGETERLKRD